MAEEQSSQEEQIGYHKGSLSVLSKEREELMRILSIVEQLMQVHVKSLKDLGVDLQQQVQEQKGSDGEKKPIEDILK